MTPVAKKEVKVGVLHRTPSHHPQKSAHAAKQPHAPVEKKRYCEGVGRRKTAVARIRVSEGPKQFVVNGMPYQEYFKMFRLEKIVTAPLSELGIETPYSISGKVTGGGVKAQAEAVRHGLARALVLLNEEYKKRLRKLGFLTRDSRRVERKKYGLKKARRAPQWAKR